MHKFKVGDKVRVKFRPEFDATPDMWYHYDNFPSEPIVIVGIDRHKDFIVNCSHKSFNSSAWWYHIDCLELCKERKGTLVERKVFL